MRNLRQTAQHKGRARSATPLDRSRCILCLREEHAVVPGVFAATVANMVAGTKVRIHGLTGGRLRKAHELRSLALPVPRSAGVRQGKYLVCLPALSLGQRAERPAGSPVPPSAEPPLPPTYRSDATRSTPARHAALARNAAECARPKTAGPIRMTMPLCGSQGIVVSYNPDTGRYVVSVASSRYSACLFV